jgi:phosphoribosylglycinamide formyltransferase-1
VPARVVVLASGAGSTLQALLDAAADPAFGADIMAVGSDRPGVEALERGERAGAETFVVRVPDFDDRLTWDLALTERVAGFEPDLVVSAGFLKLVGPAFLQRFENTYVNSHPALSPSFPGIHAPADALAWGVKVTGCTLFVVDAGVDTGPVIDQRVVPVLDDDDVDTLHERIKTAEREMLVDNIGAMVRQGWTVTGRKVHINP